MGFDVGLERCYTVCYCLWVVFTWFDVGVVADAVWKGVEGVVGRRESVLVPVDSCCVFYV